MLQYEIAISFFEAFVYISFLKFYIARNMNRKEALISYSIFFCGMLMYRIFFESYMLFMLLSIGSITVFCVYYGTRSKKSLLLGIIVTLANLFSGTLSSLLMLLTYGQMMRQIDKDTSLYIIGAMVCKFILFTLLRLIIRFNKKHDRTLPKLQWYGVMSVPVISIFSALRLIIATGHFVFASCTYAFVLLNGLITINMISFIIYDELSKRSKIMMEKEHENLRLEAENKRYIVMIAYVDEIHSFMHDIQEHLRNVLSLAVTERYCEMTDYIRKLDIKVTEMYENSILPQYPAVDTVLRQKTVQARNQGIILDSNITVPYNMPVDPIDLCIILGNALDNAIEACSKLRDERRINLEMFLTKNRLIMKITNPSEPVIIVNDKCTTTKEDANKHGYGLFNIQRTIEKYNGNVLLRYSDGNFMMIGLILF